jgi:hypothetical protein
MKPEKKTIRYSADSQLEDNDLIMENLEKAMLESKRMKMLVDLFLLALFFVFITFFSF